MYRVLSITLCFLMTGSVAFAQTPADSIWTHNLIGSVALSQVAFKDWAQGGESAVAWTLNFDGKSERDVTKTNWVTTYKAALGQTRQGDSGFRKTDDKIDIESVLTYKMSRYVNPFVSGSLKTQFAPGRKFADDGTSIKVSQFFDPAYLTQSVGYGYKPRPQIKTRLGLALRETITRRFNSFSNDPTTAKIEKFKVEGGLESVSNYEWNLASNIILNGKFEVFMAFDRADDPVIRSDTTLVMKVNSYITTNINMQVLKDSLSSPRTQLKEALSVGVSYSVF